MYKTRKIFEVVLQMDYWVLANVGEQLKLNLDRKQNDISMIVLNTKYLREMLLQVVQQ